MVKKALKGTYITLMYLFLYLPIFLLIVYSFNDSRYRGSWSGFTFRWYRELFQDRTIVAALYNTFTIALLAALIATVIGTVSAVAIHNMSPKAKVFFMNVTYLPVLNPDIVIGISLLALFVWMQLKLGFITLLLAHITFNIPYVILAVLPKLKQLNPHLEEAALDLGATPLQAFFKVILPEIMPGVITGALLAFTLSLDDFMVSFFTTGSGINTLSIKIYSMTKLGVSPKINALSALLFIGVIGLLGVLQARIRKIYD
ncbi:spermidine/putrescine transport system permease protein [Geosporobacter subterraneus DSM 17957]|uniref:Spermidine/putrescine transport system permease protein n=1 Tax=Geosporobacter subterraneus DSM 17957 TaxID=1121919 RepID=A0A1M6JQH2_9FIRM|nr:ABC transporter permease subunit [Geosporobacter subterraneus]SHJ48928.1 spermidine/putrescine transport system permease protein [Geosporobacter subterraneus DSM 17957]